MVALTAGSLSSLTFQASSLGDLRTKTGLGVGLMSRVQGLQNSLGAELGNKSNLIAKPQLPPPKSSKDGFISRFEDPKANTKIVERLKNRLKDARANTKIIEGENFSKMDLRDFDLNGIGFKDCNFSGAKFPSLDSVIFYNSCNLENADFSNIVLKKVNFGDRIYENQINELISNIGRNQLLINRINDFDISNNVMYFKYNIDSMPQKEIQSKIEDLTAKTKLEPEILRITNANFAGTKFENLWSYNSNFSGSDFSNAEIRINQASIGDVSIYIPSATGLDLTGAIFKFYDIQGKEIQQTRGAKQLNLESIEGLKGGIGNNGVVSEDYLKKWNSDKEIIILLNADKDKIPSGLKIQNSNPNYTSLKVPQDINDIEEIGAELCNEFFGRYNIKFVTNKDIKDKTKEVDYNLHFNFINSELAGGTQLVNFFGFGNKDHVIFMNTYKTGEGDFWSVFLHEMTHFFLQDPVRQSDLFYPAKISYLLPMVKHPDKTGKFVAKNILPIQEPSIVDQKQIQKYMGLFGRKPKITADLTSKYYPKNLGMTTSYNPDKNFNNIVEISSKDCNDENHIIIMNGEKALSYCTNSDPYKCHPAKGLEGSQAILTINKKTGTVLSMIMLGGENPKIKIDDKLFDVKDLTEKDIYSFIVKDSQGNIGYDKYKGLSFIESNYLVKANETLVNQDEERPSENIDLKKDLEVKALVASELRH